MQKGGIVQTTKLSGMDGKKNLAQRQYNWIMGEIENITNSLSSFVLKRNKGNDKTIPISTRRSILAIIRSLLNIISIAKRNGAALSMTFGNFESARTNQGTEVYDLVTRVENVFNSLSGPEMDEAKSYCQNILRILENAANINNMRIVSSANITSVEDDVEVTVSGSAYLLDEESEESLFDGVDELDAWGIMTNEREVDFLQMLNEMEDTEVDNFYIEGGAQKISQTLSKVDQMVKNKRKPRKRKNTLGIDQIDKKLRNLEAKLIQVPSVLLETSPLKDSKPIIMEMAKTKYNKKIDELIESLKNDVNTLLPPNDRPEALRALDQLFERLRKAVEMITEMERYLNFIFQIEPGSIENESLEMSVSAIIAPQTKDEFWEALTDIGFLAINRVDPNQNQPWPRPDENDSRHTEASAATVEEMWTAILAPATGRNGGHISFAANAHAGYERGGQLMALLFPAIGQNIVAPSDYQRLITLLEDLDNSNSLVQGAFARMGYIRPTVSAPTSVFQSMLDKCPQVFSTILLLSMLWTPSQLPRYLSIGNTPNGTADFHEEMHLDYIDDDTPFVSMGIGPEAINVDSLFLPYFADAAVANNSTRNANNSTLLIIAEPRMNKMRTAGSFGFPVLPRRVVSAANKAALGQRANIFPAGSPFIGGNWDGYIEAISTGDLDELNARSHVALISARDQPLVTHMLTKNVTIGNSSIKNECQEFTIFKSLSNTLFDMIRVLFLAPLVLTDTGELRSLSADAEVLHNSMRSLIFSGGSANTVALNFPRDRDQCIRSLYVYLLCAEVVKHLQSIREIGGLNRAILYPTKGNISTKNLLFEISWQVIHNSEFAIDTSNSNIRYLIRKCVSGLLLYSLEEIRQLFIESLTNSLKFINAKTYAKLQESRNYDLTGLGMTDNTYQAEVGRIIGQLIDNPERSRDQVIREMIEKNFNKEEEDNHSH